jgi:hypothetical protein
MRTQRTPDEIWSALEKEARSGDDAEMSVEDAIKELAAAGVDVAKEQAEARGIRTGLERNIAARAGASRARGKAQGRTPRPSSTRTRIVWLAAAAVLIASAAAAYMHFMHGQDPHPDAPMQAPSAPVTAPPPPANGKPPSTELIAADLRRQAFAACDAERWGECMSLLKRARDADPAGDADARVEAARQTAAAHLSSDKTGGAGAPTNDKTGGAGAPPNHKTEDPKDDKVVRPEGVRPP